MSAPRMDQVLFASGGDWLIRAGVPFVRRRFDGTEPEAYTHTRADATTCATLVDRDGVLRTAAANVLRCSWDYARGTPGLMLEAGATNLVGYSTNFGSWTDIGTPVATSGQADPAGGTNAYLLEDNDAGAVEGKFLAVTFTGDGTKAVGCYMKAGTASESRIGLWDNTASAWRHLVAVTWTAGVPSLARDEGSGVLFPVEAIGASWYRLMFNATGIVAANTNRLIVYLTSDSASATGTVYVYGAHAENALYPGSYVPSNAGGTVSRAADALTFPVGGGPEDLTVYARLPRPRWADATGTLPHNCGIVGLGTDVVDQGALLYGDAATRTWYAWIGGQNVGAAIPSGTPQELCAQFRFATDGACRIDVGSGYSALSGAAADRTFANQTLRLGATGVGSELDGAIERLVVARGLFTLAEMQAAPRPEIA